MPSRVVRAEINASESLSRVSLQADLTFRALIVAVDDYGRIDGRPAALKAALFPVRETLTTEEVSEWIDELTEEGCVRRYAVGGREYLQLTAWEKHRGRAKRAKYSKCPEPLLNPDSPGFSVNPPENPEKSVKSARGTRDEKYTRTRAKSGSAPKSKKGW